MIIGKFYPSDKGYVGDIASLGLHAFSVRFTPVAVKGKGPDLIVTSEREDESSPHEIGAAWIRTSKAGKQYHSVKLDGPGLLAPVHCALMQQPDGFFALIWNRETRASDEEASTPPEAA